MRDGDETLREWFADFTQDTGETPTHIVLSWGDTYRTHDDWPELPIGLTTFEGLDAALLDKPFDAGFGSEETPNLCAWSQSWVLFSSEYDGSERLHWVPRDPMPHEPIRP